MLNLKDDSWMMSPFPKDQLTVIFENAYFVKKCGGCENAFTAIIRKHHCRGCGKVFCGQCTRKKLFNKDKEPLRLCQRCEIKRTPSQRATPSYDKENISYYGNALKLTFDLEGEDENLLKTPLTSVSSCVTPALTPVKEQANPVEPTMLVPMDSTNITIRTPMPRKHLDMIRLAFTPPQSPNNTNNSKSDKRGVLNFCCIFLALFCLGWLSTHLTANTTRFISEPGGLLLDQNVIPFESVFLEGTTDLQTMIDMQVQLVESHMITIPIEDVTLVASEVAAATESVHTVSVSVVKNKDRFFGFKHQLAKWGGFRGVLRRIWSQFSGFLGKAAEGITNYFRRRKTSASPTTSSQIFTQHETTRH